MNEALCIRRILLLASCWTAMTLASPEEIGTYVASNEAVPMQPLTLDNRVAFETKDNTNIYMRLVWKVIFWGL